MRAARAGSEAPRGPRLVPSLLGPRAARREEAAARPRATGQGQNVRPGPAEEGELGTRAALLAVDVLATSGARDALSARTPPARARVKSTDPRAEAKASGSKGDGTYLKQEGQ